MTDRPRLYPGHEHQWVSVTCGRVHAVGEECNHPTDLVHCTVCGFTVPRNAAGLDGQIRADLDAAIAAVEAAPAFRPTWESPGLALPPQPEQETRA